MAELKIALIGRGYSMATFLAYAPWAHYAKYAKQFNLRLTVDIYGQSDPWAPNIRGAGIVNHADYMWSRSLSGFSSIPSARSALHDKSANIFVAFQRMIESGEGEFTNGKVNFIGDVNGIKVKKVSVNSRAGFLNHLPNQTFTVTNESGENTEGYHLVIYAGGAGGARDGKLCDENNKSISLDAYMSNGLLLDRNNFVALQGENAGVDAAVEVIKRGGKLVWIMSPGKAPVWLKTNHYHIDNDGNNWVISEGRREALTRVALNLGLEYDPYVEVHRNEQDLKESIKDKLKNNDQIAFEWLKKECEKYITYYDRKDFNINYDGTTLTISKKDPDNTARITYYDDGERAQIDRYQKAISRHVFAVGQEALNFWGPITTLLNGGGDLTDLCDSQRNAGVITQIARNRDLRGQILGAIKNDAMISSLRPVLDKNQYFGDLSDTILALQYKYSSLYFNEKDQHAPCGLFVIGAALPELANYLSAPNPTDEDSAELWLKECGLDTAAIKNAHPEANPLNSYATSRFQNVGALVANVCDKLSFPTVVAAAQLGAIRAQIQALFAGSIMDLTVVPVQFLDSMNYLNEIAQTPTNTKEKGVFEYRYNYAGDTPPPTFLKHIKEGIFHSLKEAELHPVSNHIPHTLFEDIDLFATSMQPYGKGVEQGSTLVIRVNIRGGQAISGLIQILQDYIDSNINFNGLDLSHLNMLISARFVHLSAAQCERWAGWIRSEMGKHPWGIDYDLTQEIMEELFCLNERFKPDEENPEETKFKPKYRIRRVRRRF